MIAIIDYGAGNLFSVKNALDYIGEQNTFTKDSKVIEQADGLILPGVGAFPDAMQMLHDTGLVDVIKQQAQEKPFLGICLGMQMLFETGSEFQNTEGLGLIPGSVDLMKTSLKIPHMGWNELVINKKSELLEGLNNGDFVYFVHSFMAYTEDENISAYCEYDGKVTAVVEKGRIFGTQFHPEKSGETGLKILKNFCGLTKQ
ncbi:MAG: imidazole glycerol phosphate synthase, glutamine amidotransferase subunit [Oscillospiraceae bacterium]|nr:imidazole glycerol phosphate synthase, glutamine amidotransferase subunit [Oscillospiraceae bacterium]